MADNVAGEGSPGGAAADIEAVVTSDGLTQAFVTQTTSTPTSASTFIPLTSTTVNTSLVTTNTGDLATRATFLCFFIVLGFVGNCVLLATIAQSTRLKGSALNIFVISIAVVNLLDCILNMPLILGTTISQEWQYGDLVCKMTSMSIQTCSLVMILGLTAMTFDRFIAVSGPTKYKKRLNTARANVIIIYTWVHGVAFSLPIVLDSNIPSKPFPARYLCSISRGAPVAYVALTSLFGFIFPVVAIIVFYILIIRRAVGERVQDRPRVASRAYTDAALQPGSRFWTELNTSKYVGVLVVLWCVFQGPYLLLGYVEQYRNSDQFEQQTGVAYPWQIELSFTWMKLSYPIFLPLITFCWRKEVWQKFKNLILCRKSNLINDSVRHISPTRRRRPLPPSRLVSDPVGRRPQAVRDSGPVSLSETNTNDSVPVLFATEDGLHFQSYGNRAMKDDDESPEEDSLGELEASKTSKIPTARKCDVFGSQLSFKHDNEDVVNTSDYNSSGEVDPFSNSNTISVRTEYEQSRGKSSSLTRSEEGRRTRQNSEGSEQIEGSQKRRKKKRQISPRDIKNDSGVFSNQETKERNKKNKQAKEPMGDVIEKVYDQEKEKVDETKEESKPEHNRTSSDSGQGSHEGSMSKRERKRNKSRETSDVEANEVFDNEAVKEAASHTQVDNSGEVTNLQNNKIDNDDKIQIEGVTNMKPKKKRKRRRKKMDDADNEIVNRPLPELRSGKNVKTELYEAALDITGDNPQDAEIFSELQIHQPPPVRLRPLVHNRDQIEMAAMKRRPSDRKSGHKRRSTEPAENVTELTEPIVQTQGSANDSENTQVPKPKPRDRSSSTSNIDLSNQSRSTKPERKRHDTGSSQQPLLLDSGTSTDLSEISKLVSDPLTVSDISTHSGNALLNSTDSNNESKHKSPSVPVPAQRTKRPQKTTDVVKIEDDDEYSSDRRESVT